MIGGKGRGLASWLRGVDLGELGIYQLRTAFVLVTVDMVVGFSLEIAESKEETRGTEFGWVVQVGFV